MKKLIPILIIIVLIFSVSSCATVKKDIELSQEQANIQSIEIYNPDHPYYVG